MNRSRAVLFLYVCISATAVYVFAHWDALSNPCVIHDDVRQQIFWMQKWQDSALYQDDPLARYAANYVPWGVQAIYRGAAYFINPVQFTKPPTGPAHFEPFGTAIARTLSTPTSFALLDQVESPPIYHAGGVRVIPIRRTRNQGSSPGANPGDES